MKHRFGCSYKLVSFIVCRPRYDRHVGCSYSVQYAHFPCLKEIITTPEKLNGLSPDHIQEKGRYACMIESFI